MPKPNPRPRRVPPPPGTVIDHSPASTGIYIGSPSIAILPDGAYVASHDQFGPGSTEHTAAVTLVFRSEDRGATWRRVARIQPAFWSNLFVHAGALYLFGVTHHHGLLVIRRSEDGGRTWTEPRDASSGLLTPWGQYHTAPMPMLVHHGRIWRGVEDATAGTVWGRRYNPLFVSAPSGADLLRRDSWIFSDLVRQSPDWLGGLFGGWLEGSAVVLPDGRIGDMLRVDYPPGGKAALVTLGADGRTTEFAPDTGFIDLPGGPTKFAVRHDPVSGFYWTLANAVPPRHAGRGRNQALIRNTLVLLRSPDLRRWELRHVPLHHRDTRRHAFQYVDWLIEGNDLVIASRTAWDDAHGGAHTAHDANFLTFHRLTDFRRRTPADSPVNPFAAD